MAKRSSETDGLRPLSEAHLTPGEKEALSLPDSKPATGTAVCTVFCKWPGGMILRAGKMVEQSMPSPLGAPISELRFRETGRHRVSGPAAPFGFAPRVPVVGGYAITKGVPKDLWDAWYASNKDAEYVKNRIIYAEDDDAYGRDKAFELRDTATGFEPMNQGKDPRAKMLQNPHANPLGFGVEQGTEAA